MGFGTNLIITIFVAAAIMTGLGAFMLGMGNEYGQNVPEQYQDLFQNYSQTVALYEQQQNTTAGGVINEQGDNIGVFTAVITAGQQLQQSGSLATRMLGELSDIMGINPTIIVIVSSIIFILLTAAFIALIAGRTP